MEATDEQVSEFGRALSVRLDGLDRTQFAARVGVSSSAISLYIHGRSEPSRDKVFAMEEELGVKPGSLSRLLGYLPPCARGASSVLDAIEHDPKLTDDGRRALRAVYEAMVKR